VPSGSEGSCFDAALARGPVRRVAVARIVDPLPVTHAAEQILVYRRAMLAGELFPPVSVLAIFGRLVLADGHKRLAAFRELGQPEIVVEVWGARRWLVDQARQVAGTGRRLTRATRLLFVSPRESWALFTAAPRHWWRVARSLGAHAATFLAGRSRTP
jgi:hypothetical protein